MEHHMAAVGEGRQVVSTDPVVRPNKTCPQPTSSCDGSLAGGLLCQLLMTPLMLGWFASVVSPSIYVMLAWWHVIGWRIFTWIKGCVSPSFSAQFLHAKISPVVCGI
jgi:predicted lipid-binding transport protein (Tim44 family)